MCQHQPRCPQSWEPDRLAARIVADRAEQGWSLLCNCLVLFEDDSELVVASAIAQKGRENCGYVRALLARKQPEFARALGRAEREFTCRGHCLPHRTAYRLLRDRASEWTNARSAATHAA